MTLLHRRRRQGGFTLIEVMVVVAVIAIIAAIALPNFKRAMRKTRRQTAYDAAIKISNAIEMHTAVKDVPPTYATMNLRTLRPLVESGSMTRGEVRSSLRSFEGNQLDLYYTFNGAGWNMGSDTPFLFYFRPDGEPDADCYAWSKWGRCWYPEEGVVEYFSGDWN